MRNVLVCLTATTLALALVACNSPSNDASAQGVSTQDASTQDTGTQDAIEYTVYPHDASDIMLGLPKVEEPPEDIFTTPASENGKEGQVYKFVGEVTGTDEVEGYKAVTIKTNIGEMVIVNLYSSDTNQNPIYIPEGEQYFTLPEVGETACVYAEYSGYSDVLDAPVSYLGSTDAMFHVFEAFADEDKTDEPAEPEKTNEVDVEVYQDDYVSIHFIGCEVNDRGDEQIVFMAENKTDVEITFQSSSLALDGLSLGHISGSENVAAQSKGKIRFKTEENFPTMVPSTISGNISVIDFSKSLWERQSYDVQFSNVSVG